MWGGLTQVAEFQNIAPAALKATYQVTQPPYSTACNCPLPPYADEAGPTVPSTPAHTKKNPALPKGDR